MSDENVEKQGYPAGGSPWKGRLTLRLGDGNRFFREIRRGVCEFKGLRVCCKILIIRAVVGDDKLTFAEAIS